MQQLFSCFGVGDLTWLVVVQQLSRFSLGRHMRNPFSVCIVLFCLLVCCFLFNILHKPAPEGAVASPSPPRTFRRILTGSDFKGRTWVFLGMPLSGDTLKSQVFVWSQDGLETCRALPGQVWLSVFDYK